MSGPVKMARTSGMDGRRHPLISRYVDLGAIGAFPDLYEPVWYPEKAIAAVGEAFALLAAVLLAIRLPRGRGPVGAAASSWCSAG